MGITVISNGCRVVLTEYTSKMLVDCMKDYFNLHELSEEQAEKMLTTNGINVIKETRLEPSPLDNKTVRVYRTDYYLGKYVQFLGFRHSFKSLFRLCPDVDNKIGEIIR